MDLEERIVLNAAGLADVGEDDASEPDVPMHDPVPAAEAEASDSARPTEAETEIVFVDSSVRGAAELARNADDGVEVVVLKGDQDGIREITRTLSTRTNVSAVHIVSHGAPGQVTIGSSVLEMTTLNDYRADLQAWGEALTADGDILLYGCAAGQGVEGIALVQGISDVTDADVAASTNETVSTEPGGDWTLEYATGPIEAVLPFDPTDSEVGLDTITVTTLADQSDGGAAGGWSLRDAVLYGNTNAGADTINLPAGTYTLAIAGRAEDVGLTGDLDVLGNLTIQGAGAETTIIDGNGIDRVLDVFPGVTLELKDVTIANGSTEDAEHGGGVRNDGGTLVAEDSRIVDNRAGGGAFDGANGGGIYSTNSGSVMLDHTVVSGNLAHRSQGGGGIYIVGGTLTINESTISHNVSDGEHSTVGGAVYIGSGTAATITHTTISDNRSDDRGGGIYSAGTTEIENSNVVANDARVSGGGIYVAADSSMELTRCIVMGNTLDGELGVTASDVSGDFDPDSTGNLIGVLHGSTGLTADEDPWEPPAVIPVPPVPTVTVTTLADQSDGGAAGGWSLRDAVLYGNTNAGNDVISLPAGTYTLALTGRAENAGLTGDLDVLESLTILGAGADTTIIDANGIDRVFDVFAGVTLTLKDVTIANGSTEDAEHGGGVQSDGGTLIVEDSEIVDNRAGGGAFEGANGGGIYSSNSGSVTLDHTVVSGNLAHRSQGGGGVYIVGGTLTINESRFTQNVSDGEHATVGGALYIGTGTTATITHTTLSDNRSDDRGGAIYSAGTTEIENSNVLANDAPVSGGGIYVAAGTPMKLTQCIVMGNTLDGEIGVTASDVSGDFDPDSTGNLIGVLHGSTGLTTDEVLWVPPPVTPAPAATVTVTTVADQSDGGAAGGWSLRDAVLYANSNAGSDVIDLPAGTYTLTLAGRAENAGLTGDLDVLESLTIQGADAETTIIDGNGIDRVLDVFPGATLVLRDVTIANGSTEDAEHGGGVRNSGGTLNAEDSRIVNNRAGGGAFDGANGGGIYSTNSGNVTLDHTVVSGNLAHRSQGGGGIYIVGGALTINESTITHNVSDGEHATVGGAVYIGSGTTATITHSTLSDNRSDDRGGGIYSAGTTEVENTNVLANDAWVDGGGIYVAAGSSTKLTRCIVMGNTLAGGLGVAGSDVSGDFHTDSTENLIGVLSGSTGLATDGYAWCCPLETEDEAEPPLPCAWCPPVAAARGPKAGPAAEAQEPAEAPADIETLMPILRHQRVPIGEEGGQPEPGERDALAPAAARRVPLDMSAQDRADREPVGPSQNLLSRAANAFRGAGLDASSALGEMVADNVEGGSALDTWMSGASIFEKWLRIGMSRSSSLRVPLVR